jgi:signal transduction histidine kinase/CheY-like chemotaxis protein
VSRDERSALTTSDGVVEMARRDVARRSIAAGVAYPLALIVVVVFSEGVLGVEIVGALAVLLVVASTARVALGLAFEPLHARNAAVWRLTYHAALTTSAAAWALCTAAFLVGEGLRGGGVLALVATFAFCSAAVAALSPSLRAMRVYLTVLLAPIVAAPLVRPEPELWGMTALALLYGGYLWHQGGSAHTSYWTRLINDRLLERRARELETARRVAEDASRAKGEFLANVSHELRTPLNGILGMTELVLDSDIRLEQRDQLLVARRSAESLLRLVDDVLDVSRLESGRIELETTSFDLRRLICAVLDGFEERASSRGISLCGHVDGSVPRHVIGDPGRLRQLLRELLGNAIKFTDHGRVTLRARVEERDGDATTLAVEVEDTGVGIPNAEQARVFEAFRQVDGSATRRHRGAGLGLTIAQRLATLMQGRLWVESEAGIGSIFHLAVRLGVVREVEPERETTGSHPVGDEPAKTIVVDGPTPPSSPDGPRDAPEPSLEGCRALVVEDNPINLRLAARLLERLGVRVDSASDGREAIRRLETASFDVVLMDLQMPVLDGISATREIRTRSEPWRGVPILALTANAPDEERSRCLGAGMDGFLTKPLRRENIVEEFERCLSAPSRPACDVAQTV